MATTPGHNMPIVGKSICGSARSVATTQGRDERLGAGRLRAVRGVQLAMAAGGPVDFTWSRGNEGRVMSRAVLRGEQIRLVADPSFDRYGPSSLDRSNAGVLSWASPGTGERPVSESTAVSTTRRQRIGVPGCIASGDSARDQSARPPRSIRYRCSNLCGRRWFSTPGARGTWLARNHVLFSFSHPERSWR